MDKIGESKNSNSLTKSGDTTENIDKRMEKIRENPPQQQEFCFGPKDWDGVVPDVDYVSKDRYDEAPDFHLKYIKGKFFVDSKEVLPSEFLKVLGRGASIAYKQQPGLKEVFEKELAKEKASEGFKNLNLK